MRVFQSLVIFITLCLLTPLAIAQDRILSILVGLDKPPYIQLQDGTGFELELLRAVVNEMGYSSVFMHVPNARISYLLEQGNGDIATLQGMQETSNQLLYSQPYIRYQNAVVTLREHDHSINELSDLAGLNIVAFQGASRVLGEAFAASVEHANRYTEVTNQRSQVDLLLLQRIDAAITDINIFQYYRRVANDHQPIQLHLLFPPSDYRCAFRDPLLQQQFNQALKTYQASSDYQRLQLEYFGAINQPFATMN